MAVPLDLRSRVGLSEVRISLKTGYSREATTKARKLAAAGRTIFTQIRNHDMPELDRRELARMVKVYFNEHLLEYEDHTIMNGPDTEERLKESLDELTAIRENIRKNIALRRYDTVVTDVAHFSEANELETPPDSPEYPIIAHELLKANHDMLTVLFHRQQGDFGQEDDIIAKYAVEDVQSVQAATSIEENTGITLSELIDKYCEFKITTGKWTGRSITEGPKKFSTLRFVLGDVPVNTINADTAMHFLDCLRRLPMRLDAARFKGKTLDDLLAMEDEKHLTVKSINMRMEDATGLFNYAVENDYAEKNYFQNKRLRDDESDEERRLPFTDEDLALIFGSENYLEYCGKDASRYWLPILGLYTGARLEELAQLHVEDIRKEDGILVLDINDKGDKRTKNKSSRRLVRSTTRSGKNSVSNSTSRPSARQAMNDSSTNFHTPSNAMVTSRPETSAATSATSASRRRRPSTHSGTPSSTGYATRTSARVTSPA
jgi:integrase